MKREPVGPIMTPWAEAAPGRDPRANAARQLFRRLQPPAPITPERKARIESGLDAALSRRRMPARWRGGLVVVGVGALALGFFAVSFMLRQSVSAISGPPEAMRHRLDGAERAARASTALSAQPREQRTPLAEQEPRARKADRPRHMDSRKASTVALREGRQIVESEHAATVIETPSARIELPRHARVEITVSQRALRVASLRSRVIVEWLASGERIEVPAGQVWSRTAQPGETSGPPPLSTAAAPSPPVTVLGEELRLWAAIFNAQKEDRSGASVLALLDEYVRKFPEGTFVQEAKMVRIDALVRRGRSDAALALLDPMMLDGHAKETELRVLRGELRLERRRLRDAIEDFDRALERGAPDESAQMERALYGRAAALAALGDVPAARVALGRYLDRYPHGRFATPARAALKNE